jgi:hypothetical protein
MRAGASDQATRCRAGDGAVDQWGCHTTTFVPPRSPPDCVDDADLFQLMSRALSGLCTTIVDTVVTSEYPAGIRSWPLPREQVAKAGREATWKTVNSRT